MKIRKAKGPPESIKFKTRLGVDGTGGQQMLAEWWKARDDRQLALELCGTAAYLKTLQTYRIRQLAASIRLYAGLSVYSYAGSNVSKMDRTKTLPNDTPTFNLIQACTDTLVSRLTQNKPQPKFLTDNSDYKERHLAQELNQFILGEFYQTKAYEKASKVLKDAIVMGTGALKIYEGDNNKVCVDRVLQTDLYVDDNDSLNGDPQQLIQLKLVDRDKVMAANPTAAGVIAETPTSYPDNSSESGRTTTDQILVVEAWKLPSGPDPEAPGYIPGRHTLATQAGVIYDEPWTKPKFPFVFLNYSDPFTGFWGQGLGTQLFGTQISLERILKTITRAIVLVGVPRVFIEQSSKVVKAHNNNEIGVMITYSGTKPSYEIAPCNAPELYAERDKLIEYGFRQCGISDMQATGEKPGGLNSGEAIRSYDDVNSDRFAELSNRYDQVFIDLAYQITDCAMDIAKREGKYQTVYPNRDGTKEIDLPKMTLIKDPFVIQCFNESSLPRTPAGRIATVTEQVQAGMLTLREGRRLLKFPDLEQDEKLANASEERIFKILDDIVHDGKYTPPDPFIDLQLAVNLVVQYINLYLAANIEEEKAELLRTFFKQCQTLIQMGTPAPQPQLAPPTASAAPAPVSPLVPQNPPAAA
jgi:Phage portal protein, SPP1 Gp6-like